MKIIETRSIFGSLIFGAEPAITTHVPYACKAKPPSELLALHTSPFLIWLTVFPNSFGKPMQGRFTQARGRNQALPFSFHEVRRVPLAFPR